MPTGIFLVNTYLPRQAEVASGHAEVGTGRLEFPLGVGRQRWELGSYIELQLGRQRWALGKQRWALGS